MNDEQNKAGLLAFTTEDAALVAINAITGLL